MLDAIERAGEIGAIEPGIAQIGVPKVSPGQIGARECGETQRGVPEARGRKIDGSATDRPHLPLADAERDTGQIRDGRGILRAPSIPRPRAAAQRFDMLGLCGHNARNNEKRNSHERYKDDTQRETKHNEEFTLMQTRGYRQAPRG